MVDNIESISINGSVPKKDTILRLLEALPKELEWATEQMQNMPAYALESRVFLMKDLSEAIRNLIGNNKSSPTERKLLLRSVIEQLQWAADILKVGEDKSRRHKANNILQLVEHANFFLNT
jgi:hypothetical protein